jgi:hypothetical protein
VYVGEIPAHGAQGKGKGEQQRIRVDNSGHQPPLSSQRFSLAVVARCRGSIDEHSYDLSADTGRFGLTQIPAVWVERVFPGYDVYTPD